MARTNLNVLLYQAIQLLEYQIWCGEDTLLYQGEEEGRVVGVLEVQQEARLIERLWEEVGEPLTNTTGEGEAAAQVLF